MCDDSGRTLQVGSNAKYYEEFNVGDALHVCKGIVSKCDTGSLKQGIMTKTLSSRQFIPL